MRYLGLALYAEGTSDYSFLAPLLHRVCGDLCLRLAREPVEVSPVLRLTHPRKDHGSSREARIRAAAKDALGSWEVLFVHADGGGDPRKARRERVDPALRLLRDEFGARGRGVAVIPVRELEAWTLVDGDALREALGTNLSDEDLGLPRSDLADRESDPKGRLAQALQASGIRRIRGSGEDPYLAMIAEQVSLEALHSLAAFRALEEDLERALEELGIVR